MKHSMFGRDDLLPKSADSTSRGLGLAALVHVGLLVAIAFGVSWRASEPEGVEAELWAAVPQIAAQRAVEPEPPRPEPKPEPRPQPRPEAKPEVERPDPQIAIEKARQEKLKKQKLEEEKREREEKDKLEKKRELEKKEKDKAEAERRKKDEARQQAQLDAQREANIKRILGEAGATGTTPGGKAATTAGPSASWNGRVIARVKPNFVYTDAIQGDPAVEVELKLGPDGTIVGRKLVKSSGDTRLDDAVLRAIDKTEMLPRDTDGTVPPSGVIVFRPGRF